MKTRLLLRAVILMIALIAAPATPLLAQNNLPDTCGYFVDHSKLHHLLIVTRIYCTDSTNFHVYSFRKMPFSCKYGDSLTYRVCLMPHDGKIYSTKVVYETDYGDLSYKVTMRAPLPPGGNVRPPTEPASISVLPKTRH